MKHIKKTYRFERPITKEEEKKLDAKFERVPVKSAKKPEKGVRVFMVSESEKGNKIIEGFHISKNGKHYCIPEPDPVLIYFHTAYSNWKVIREKEQALLEQLSGNIINESVSTQIYAHFGVCMGFATSLLTSIEAFINGFIPNDFVYREKQSKRTIEYDKNQITWINFEDKWTKVLEQCVGKSFSKSKPTAWQHLTNLRDFRNMIVHTKMDQSGMTPYDYLFKKSFSFKYEEALHAARDFINFYRPGYIVECDCGGDF